MEMNVPVYDVAIAGGGLAGLSLAIQLARHGFKVIVFEKEQYPFHKVCGEYISFESWNFLEELGIPLSDWNLPIIKRLEVSAPDGELLEAELPLGGFGISRYKLDAALAIIAKDAGVILLESTKVTDIQYRNGFFSIQANGAEYCCKVACGSFGKRSNLDIRWKRNFARHTSTKLNNYIGVKYHVETDLPADLAGLHNFKNGYCGISQIEDKKYCLCYLTTADNLNACNNSIPLMEEQILWQNPRLAAIFSNARFLFESPVTISKISFEKKKQVENHVIFVGDAAGMITPLCGNGMSMALNASKIAFECIREFLLGRIERHEMEQNYTDSWHREFGHRLWIGRRIQQFFGGEKRTIRFVRFLKSFPKLAGFLIRQTHGEPF